MAGESSGRQAGGRFWRIVEGVGVTVGAVALIGMVTMRDQVRDSTAFNVLAAIFHNDVDQRLEHLERPELIIQLAQAAVAVDDLEETAELARSNATAIGNVRLEQNYQRADLARQEGYLLQLLDHANVTPKRAGQPPPRPAESP